jgi:flagellar capping protein FliD
MYENRSKSLTDRIVSMEERVLAYEKRLKRQFASLEQIVSGLSNQAAAIARMR